MGKNKSASAKRTSREAAKPSAAEGPTQLAAPSARQKQRYLQFLKSDGLLSRILDIADDAIISVDQAQRIIMFNQGAEKTFGYTADEALGQPLNILMPDRYADGHRQHVPDFGKSPIAARRMGEREGIVGRRKDGTEFPAEASISKVDIEGIRIYTVILRDMTQHRQAEERIKASLREKEVLLKEIHHRVKNNLQVVSSLLNLQSRGIHDERTRQKFKESQNRVQSMALIHEQLYQTSKLSLIDYPAYIRQLSAHLFRSYHVSTTRIDLRTRIDDVRLSVDVAVPCGLIINELVSNSLKYAFPDGRGGEIRIELRRSGDDEVTLTVADDGVGLPEEVGFWDTKTLGLRLVGTLARQLDGNVEVDRSGGTAIRISFAPES